MSSLNGKNRQPKIANQPTPQKVAKFATDPKVRGGPIVWRFSHADMGGPFAWCAIPDDATFCAVVNRLANFETMTENEITQGGSHSIELHRLSKAARDRLQEISHDDLDSLYSLRIKGAERVFCIHHGGTMRVLWYDPDHQVCPSTKKHT